MKYEQYFNVEKYGTKMVNQNQTMNNSWMRPFFNGSAWACILSCLNHLKQYAEQ